VKNSCDGVEEENYLGRQKEGLSGLQRCFRFHETAIPGRGKIGLSRSGVANYLRLS
jgi:hypothetical protein